MKKCPCGLRGPCKSIGCQYYGLARKEKKENIVEIIAKVIRRRGGLSDFDYEYYMKDAEAIYRKLKREGLLKE